MKNYGNSFVGGREAIDAGKVPVWNSVDELFPAGCTFPASAKGTVYPVGTAVYVASMGGVATVYASSTALSDGQTVTGLLLEDVVVGENGATGTIVTKGQILASRAAELSASVKAALANRITFVEEA
jgi:chitodextrinase